MVGWLGTAGLSFSVFPQVPAYVISPMLGLPFSPWWLPTWDTPLMQQLQ